MVTVELKPVITTMMTTAKACEVAHEVEVSTHAVGRVNSFGRQRAARAPRSWHNGGRGEERRAGGKILSAEQGALPLKSRELRTGNQMVTREYYFTRDGPASSTSQTGNTAL